MVDRILTKEMIDAGAVLVENLKGTSVQPDGAYWFYYSEDQKWKLVLVESSLLLEGPMSIYQKIQDSMRKNADQLQDLSLQDITLAKPDSPTAKVLRRVIEAGPERKGMRLTNNVIDGNVLDDVYVYRLV
jgi:hypothetical protein